MTGPRQQFRSSILATIAAISVTVTMLIHATWSDDARGADHDEARAAAEKVAVAVTSLRADHLDDDVKTVLNLSTGRFKEQFGEQRQSFIDTVGAAGVTSSGDVAESGIVSSTGSTVVVLLAVTATLQNDETPEDGDQRTYRMRITMAEKNGRWLASRLDLVS